MRRRSLSVVFCTAFLLVLSSACAPVAGTLSGRPTADIRKTGEERAEEGSKPVVTKPVESGRGASENVWTEKAVSTDRSRVLPGRFRRTPAARRPTTTGVCLREEEPVRPRHCGLQQGPGAGPAVRRGLLQPRQRLYQQGFYDLAIADYTKALEYNPKYDRAFNNRGTPTIKQAGTTRPSPFTPVPSRSIRTMTPPTTTWQTPITRRAITGAPSLNTRGPWSAIRGLTGHTTTARRRSSLPTGLLMPNTTSTRRSN